MRLRLVIALLGTATLAMGAVAADGATPIKTKVTIDKGGPTLFEGTVSSDEKACEKGREVALFYEPGKGGGQVVDTAKTNKKGHWEMPGEYISGLYHAEVSAKTLKKCGSAKSKRKHY